MQIYLYIWFLVLFKSHMISIYHYQDNIHFNFQIFLYKFCTFIQLCTFIFVNYNQINPINCDFFSRFYVFHLVKYFILLFFDLSPDSVIMKDECMRLQQLRRRSPCPKTAQNQEMQAIFTA